LSAKFVPNFEDKIYHLVSMTDPHGRILCVLEWSRYFFFQSDKIFYFCQAAAGVSMWGALSEERTDL
jgi:hypothetical protein